MRDYRQTNACPHCDSSNVHKRTTLSPKWLCADCRKTFERAVRRDSRRFPPSETAATSGNTYHCPVCDEDISALPPVHISRQHNQTAAEEDSRES